MGALSVDPWEVDCRPNFSFAKCELARAVGFDRGRKTHKSIGHEKFFDGKSFGEILQLDKIIIHFRFSSFKHFLCQSATNE